MSLDSNVYKTPSFTALGMQKDKQVQAQKEKLERNVQQTGAEDAFNTAKYEVTGARLQVLQDAYNLYADAAKAYESSGSDADKKLMKQYANDVNFYAGAGMAMQGKWNEEYSTALANEFEGYAESPDQITQRYQSRVNDKVETKIENGKILVKEGDKFVPANQSSYFSSQINPNNSFLLAKKVETGKYILPSALLNDVRGVLKSSSNSEEAYTKAEAEFRHRLKVDPSFRQDVGIQYAISELGIIDGKQGLSREDMRKVEERMQDEEFFGNAVNSYLGGLKITVNNQFGASSITSNASYNQEIKTEDGTANVKMYALEGKVGDIIGVGQTENGEYYVTKNIGAGAPPQTVKASEAEIAQVEQKFGKITQAPSQQTKETVVSDEAQTEETVKQEEAPAQEAPEIEMPKEEEIKSAEKTESDPLGLGFNMQTESEVTPESRQTGTAPPYNEAESIDDVPMESKMLPDSYYENLLDFEGSISTDEKDLAAKKAGNQDAPRDSEGKLQHTNRGVTYEVFKSWAADKGIPKSQYHKRFRGLSESEAVDVVNMFTRNSGSDNFESPVLRSLFTQNSWGTGKVWAADFKKGRSKEYRALLDWLQEETGLDFKNTGKISETEAKAIEKLFNKDPKGFVNKFIDKKKTHLSTLDTYKTHGDGWNKRAEDLRNRMIAELG